ncbi:hypothetical protein M413DRAFT_323303 [Hebeloma cylindrosporum]|uniref:Uncharacterized protein n=1 Tax=Hebeloma cylindrosporum TaxID=76867 RepID=A0A0C2XDL3_HEBCY|nr:hypothetical protein M413DRAFT_323303 [Hebeloma cylindrosporum h7]
MVKKNGEKVETRNEQRYEPDCKQIQSVRDQESICTPRKGNQSTHRPSADSTEIGRNGEEKWMAYPGSRRSNAHVQQAVSLRDSRSPGYPHGRVFDTGSIDGYHIQVVPSQYYRF